MARVPVRGHGLITDQVLDVGVRVGDPHQERSSPRFGNPDVGSRMWMASVPACHRAHRPARTPGARHSARKTLPGLALSTGFTVTRIRIVPDLLWAHDLG